MMSRVWIIALILCMILLGGWWSLTRKSGSTDPVTVETIIPPKIPLVDVTSETGIRFKHFNGAIGKKLLPETMGSGVVVFDFDQDSLPDLFFVNSRSWPGNPNPESGRPVQALYRNLGDGSFADITRQVSLDVELFGMGATAGDFDNDGFPDLYISAVGGGKLFHNEGGKRFLDSTQVASLPASSFPDVSATKFEQIDHLISFQSSVTWLDYDLDGWLDLCVCNYIAWSPAKDLGVRAVLPNGKRAYVPPTQFAGVQCQLFRNIQGKKFEDVSDIAGITISEKFAIDQPAIPIAKALGVIVCDPDEDGWPDIMIACDTVRNLFFHNRLGAEGTRQFVEIGLIANVAYAEGRPRGGMGIDIAEVLPEQYLACIANFSHEPSTLLKRRSKSPASFTDVAMATGLAGLTRNPMKFGTLFLDLDLDGRTDLLNCNGHLEPDIQESQPGQSYAQSPQLFWNRGDPKQLWYELTSKEVGETFFTPLVGRGCSYIDYDRDGDLDIVLTGNREKARLFRNDQTTHHNWISLDLHGKDGCNRDGFGAMIEIEAEGEISRHYHTASRGYLSQSEGRIHFGLGKRSKVDRLKIRWPNRNQTSDVFENLSVNLHYQVSPGSLKVQPSKQ
jgi:enediyne biosynthesis protein E4